MFDTPGQPASPRPFLLKVAQVVGLRASGSALQFAVYVLLARVLGPAGMGFYVLYNTWTKILDMVLGQGYRNYVLRTCSAWNPTQFGKRGPALLRSALTVILVSGGLLWLAAIAVAGLPIEWSADARTYLWLLPFAIAAGAALAGIRVLSESFKARGRPETGLFLEYNAQPILVLAVIGGLMLSLLGVTARIVPRIVLWIDILLLAGVLVVSLVLWPWLLHPKAGERPRRRRHRGELGAGMFAPWRRNGRVLATYWAFDVFTVLAWALPCAALPMFASKSEIGYFGVSQRLMAPATMILVGLGALYCPRFAIGFERGDVAGLRRNMLRAQLLTSSLYLPVLLGIVLFPRPILQLFGHEFAEARTLLWIMAGAQAFNALTGLSSEFLNMVRAERTEMTLIAVSLATMALLILWLGSWYGVTGVAVAYAVTFGGKNLASYTFCWLRLRQLQISFSAGGRPGPTPVESQVPHARR